MSAKVKTSPIRRDEFANLKATGQEVAAQVVKAIDVDPRTFSSGAMGYYGGEKVNVKLDGKSYRCQCSIQVVIIDSKHAPDIDF